MPLYEYRCEGCGAQEEVLESFSAPTEHACHACGAATGMHRQLSKAGFVLTGGGWYDSGYGAKADATPAAKPAAKQATEATPSTPPAASGGCGGGCSCH